MPDPQLFNALPSAESQTHGFVVHGKYRIHTKQQIVASWNRQVVQQLQFTSGHTMKKYLFCGASHVDIYFRLISLL